MRNKINFIITIFGDKHVGMLITNIYSILNSNPGNDITVIWQDIEERFIKNIIKGFKAVTFIETNFDLTSDPIKRISSKTLLWDYAAKTYPNDKLCMLDVDTLVIKDISHFFEQKFDIVFTYKHEQFPLNTGVVLCKGDKYPLFFDKWNKETIKIINDVELFKKANSPPYGSSDQMSFSELLDYRSGKENYIVTIHKNKLYLKGIPCKFLNETNSISITKSTHIIHYKGGWQPILLEGQNFTEYRTKDDSWEMYILFLETYKKAFRYLCANTNNNGQTGEYKIVIPFYLNSVTFKENKVLYVLYLFHNRLKNKLKNFLKRKLDEDKYLKCQRIFDNFLKKLSN